MFSRFNLLHLWVLIQVKNQTHCYWQKLKYMINYWYKNKKQCWLFYYISISFYAIRYPENIEKYLPSMRSLAPLYVESFLIYTLSPFLSCSRVLRLPVERFVPNALSYITSFTHKAQCRYLPRVDLTVADNIYSPGIGTVNTPVLGE